MVETRFLTEFIIAYSLICLDTSFFTGCELKFKSKSLNILSDDIAGFLDVIGRDREVIEGHIFDLEKTPVEIVYQNPKGGLNAKGRAYFKRTEGADLKPPVSAKQAAKSPKAAGRRKSFCARMGGVKGPMKDEKGRPTRKALALKKWNC